MPKVRVKSGCTYGAGGRHPSGTVLQVTDAEIVSFGDKLEVLEPVVEASPPAEPEPEAIPAAEESVVEEAKSTRGRRAKKAVNG